MGMENIAALRGATGKIARLNRSEGFGFIRQDSTFAEFFFHANSIIDGLVFTQFQENDRVIFDTQPSTSNPGKLEATNVRAHNMEVRFRPRSARDEEEDRIGDRWDNDFIDRYKTRRRRRRKRDRSRSRSPGRRNGRRRSRS